ncbi:zinc-binding dehydrogenase [Rhodococcus koreensis]|uniref:zinc-binding dehydrogenase n=1 Tax=Rhodococcus koreensis TaxID=99653 RepID=UPI003671B690
MLPDPTGHQVLVKMISTGVCQSQIYWAGQDRTQPMLFGHEGVGTVAAVGDQIQGLTVGDPVLVTWVPRKDDRSPVAGTAPLPDGREGLSPNIYTWGRHTLVDELFVVPIPESAVTDEAAVIACAVLTGAGSVTRTADVQKGNSVAVIGIGGVGLSAVCAARERGAAHVIAVDLSDEKLAFARKFGATAGVNATTDDVPGRILELTSGVDVVIDCVGRESTIDQALRSLRRGRVGIERGGSVVLVGIPEKPVVLDAKLLIPNELSLVGSMGGSSDQGDVHQYLDWAATGRLDLKTMVTNRYQLEDASKALDDLASGRVLGRSLLIMGD